MSEKAPVQVPKATTVLSYAVAILVLVAFGYLALEVLNLAKETVDEEMRWARVSQIYNSIEAIAFAAAGLLFGTVVQGKRASDAENRAEEAKENEVEAKAKGSELASKILEIEPVITEDIEEGFAPDSSVSGNSRALTEIKELAEIKALAKYYLLDTK